MDNLTCALRALSLCDGQVLEEERGVLRICLCNRIRLATECGRVEVARELMDKRADMLARIPLY